MSTITFQTTVKSIKLKEKDTYGSYAISVDPASPESGKMKICIPYFAYGTEEEWANWRKQFEQLKKRAGWTNGSTLFHNARILLRDAALQYFEMAKQSIQGDSVRAFQETLDAVSQMISPGKPALDLKRYMRDTSKPLSLTMDEYYARLEELNSLIPHFQAPGNTCFTREELRQIVECNVPRPWQAEYEASGQEFTQMSKLINYFKKCEAREQKGKNKKPKQLPVNGQPSNGNYKKREEKQKNKNKNHNDREQKWCAFHKSKTHNTAECRMKDKAKEEENHAIMSSDEECNQIVSEEGKDEIILEIPIAIEQGKGKYTLRKALLDGGSSRTLINASCVPKNAGITEERRRWKTKSGSFETTGSIMLPCKLPGFTTMRRIRHKAHIVQDKKNEEYDVILGRDFLVAMGIQMDFLEKTLTWDEVRIPMPTAKMSRDKLSEVFQQSVTLREAEERLGKILDAKYEKTDINEAIPDHLGEGDKQELLQLLKEFEDLFEAKLGTMPGQPYELPLRPNSKPYHAKAFPVPHIYVETVKKEVKRLVELGVLVEDANSEWAAPCFIIPKKNGQVRLVTDFRKLNKALIRTPFPMPRIAEILHGIQGFAYVTSLDFNMGYYSTRVSKRSSGVLTIILPWGKYQYTRLPFGISTAPDEFQRRMTSIFGDMECARVYLDDVLVITAGDFTQHLKDLRAVLNRVREAGMQVNVGKSNFVATETEYLGFLLTREGVKPLPAKVKAIQRMQSPTNKKELRRFIGMVNYYKDMWRLRAHLLTPLSALTGKKSIFTWGEEQQTAFEQIKLQICASVTLSYPDFQQPFVIFTDASTFQLGGVITQKGKPLAFFSRKLNSAQRRYTIMEQELLSIVEILREYRNILLGHKIVIYTDHKNLSCDNFQSARVQRWRLIIEEFGPEIKYVKGEHNIVADALSRHPMEAQTELQEENFLQDIDKEQDYPMSYEVIELFQEECPKLKNQEFRKNMTKETFKKRELWCFNNRIYIPTKLQPQVMEFYHEVLMHPGMNRTYQTMRPHFTWPKMKKDIEEWVSNCKICKAWKRDNTQYGKLPTKDPVTTPWTTVCIDTIGPYPRCEKKPELGKFWATTMIDPATGWFEIAPAFHRTAAEAARTLDEQWFCRYPRPQECIHDQGTEFTGADFQKVLNENGVTPKAITVKNPQANAVLERLHQVIGNHFRTSVDVNDDRVNALQAIAFAIRATYRTVTQASPAQLVFGRDMMMDTLFTANWKEIRDRKIRQVRIDNARENKTRVEHVYKEGDLVYLLLDLKTRAKMKRPTMGPYPIIQVRDNGTVVIQRGAYSETVNIRRLRPFNPQ